MLPPDWLINNLDEITVLYSDLHTGILKTIARHVANSLKLESALTPSARKQIEAAQAAGLAREEIQKHVAAALRLSASEARELFEAAGIETLRWDNEIYQEAGLSPILIHQSPAMLGILESRAGKFTGSLQRLTGTIAINSQSLFERTLNAAFNKTIAGTHSYTEALNDAMDDMLRQGITVFNYESGREISIESAILMNLRTSIGQAAGEITRQSMVEHGASYVETTAHMGARNTGEGFKNHEAWQGRLFYYSEIAVEFNSEDLPDFVEATGYGDVAGLLGANCRHSYGPTYPGITKPRYSQERLAAYAEQSYSYILPDGTEATVGAYEASQMQRGLERRIRKLQRAVDVKEAAGMDASPERIKLKTTRKRLKVFLDDTGLRRQPFRERIAKAH